MADLLGWNSFRPAYIFSGLRLGRPRSHRRRIGNLPVPVGFGLYCQLCPGSLVLLFFTAIIALAVLGIGFYLLFHC